MPDLDSLLSHTMLWTGARGANLEPVPCSMSEVFGSPTTPQPQTMEEVEQHERADTAMRNYVWRFTWDPAEPAVFRDVKIRTRGMGSDYGMVATVFDAVTFGAAKVERDDGSVLNLSLDAAHCVGAWWTRTGEINASLAALSALWKLEAKLDSSLLACFAFQLVDGVIQPLPKAEIDDLGELLMPVAGRRAPSVVAGEAEAYDVCIGPSRYVVAVELVLCRERPDFVPGTLVGFCRIHPHAFVWSNEDLVHSEVSITLERPVNAMACDPTMDPPIGALAVSDTNDDRSSSAWINLPIPYADNLYDYYETNPHKRFLAPELHTDDHSLQAKTEVTMVDPRRAERTIEAGVRRRTPLVRDSSKIRKVARQGQIDNVHLAARMTARFDDEHGEPVALKKIVMLNQCLHDCVHMHVRWGEFLEAKMMRGWGRRGPFTEPGAPAVPHNQVVFASFPSKHALTYRAVPQNVKAGEIQVICHHGLGYAVDEWPDGEAWAKIGVLHGTIAAESVLHDEPYRAQIPFGWLEFYWRVRWTGSHGHEPVERLTFDLERCMR
jgi:hypothetical protein